MKNSSTTVSNPSKAALITLRLMIGIGVCSMFFLLYSLFDRAQIGHAPFYWILMVAMCVNFLKILHEWYHYFSIAVPPEPAAGKDFTVDIFTTFCAGEPYAMVVATLEAIQQITYPHTTYLCDEADDPYLKDVCLRLNVRHITREVHTNAKAGNINNALQFASGELCVILDPDHIPQPDFLDPVIAHFNDPKIGYVQIVQAYYNLGENFIAKGAAQQTFQFYGPIMMTMNSYGTVQAIGANCTFRRAALDSIGGHAAGLAEDMHTALQLHAKGWTSVYVPAILARGLVPASLSAYYAQQLKWSRGTFEIFFTSFIRLFPKLTWRQRIHYATIPLYYLSGFIVLINFLIPIMSLSTGLIPLRMDILDFLLLGMPMIASMILIRHYVQRWVMEEKERGFHLIGGLLQIGTWWIYIIGFLYTILRKKVPYIPTPKDNTHPDPWWLNLPNLVVILVSLLAIVLGLRYDWNPYSIAMAGIAAVNCIILLTVIGISSATDEVKLRDRYEWINRSLTIPLLLKRKFWILRHAFIYTGLRKLGLLLIALSVFTAWYLLKEDARPPAGQDKTIQQPHPFLTGVFQPGNTAGLVSMKEVSAYESTAETRFSIISLYIPWGDAPQCLLPDSIIRNIYENYSLPMITWEPWTSLFNSDTTTARSGKEQQVFRRLLKGDFDHYLDRFARQIIKLNKPIFIRLAHEPDNPAYPWSPSGGNTPDEFKAGWKYIYEYFLQKGVNNVAWVWSPWKAANIEAYFPGKQYVDWLGVTMLDYGALRGTSDSFEDLYRPFHQHGIFRSGLPVMVAEMGSLAGKEQQTQWFSSAFKKISEQFPDIRAAVFFNSHHDQNVPQQNAVTSLDWQIKSPDSVLSLLKQYPRVDISRDLTFWTDLPERKAATAFPIRKLPSLIRGMNYHTAKTWYRNYHDLTRRNVTHDMQEMRSMGITTIRRYGPGIYDQNVLKVASQTGMNMMYAFWIPTLKRNKNDREILVDAGRQIIATVRSLKDQRNIMAWSIGNTGQWLLPPQLKPVAIYQQEYFLQWLNELVTDIKTIDSTRPVTIDVDLSVHLRATIAMLRTKLPAVDAYGIVMGKDTTGIAQLSQIDQTPVFVSEIFPQHIALLKNLPEMPAFIKEFQDQQTRDCITFDGVIDHWGRRKPVYDLLQAEWGTTTSSIKLPSVKILRPAVPLFSNRVVTYSALVNTGEGWRFPDTMESRLRFEWHLVKTGLNGEAIYMETIGSGTTINLNIPEEPERYRLYVEVVAGNKADGAQSLLNLPLFRMDR
ncbi:glycosyltransferase [Terrimonas sp. NA20]|uniref:Glycosyltransferase n=1 Tax=Terrimonas ginsenosidimutans TaxID=2908004 RepID=A0ABS9KK71_9BACT|nr:glycosyltransferase family 2 protein [Terrimonas ginsenosidimutans]MCG2612709.1 glycosyltransferase [Terrimonas ginsenosidimutans]